MIVADARQLSAFANPLRVRVLLECALEERSLSALERQLEMPLAKLHYHVSRLLAAKLLIVNRTQCRGGRPIKFYRAVADSFMVPQESLPALPGDRLSVELRQSLRDEQCRSGDLSMLYAPAAGGKVLARLVPRGAAVQSRGVELWRIVRIDARQRASLAKELGEILERYTATEPDVGAEAFLVHAALAPRVPSR